ncbi:hypothetical protein WMO45_04465 [Flavonifractor sp. CLA-AP-H34]|uniref:Uncharacterized protein n=1 Tax=Flavonifractor hominis TaxID=3133178 RepID=A0ABV1EQ66_9FIRM
MPLVAGRGDIGAQEHHLIIEEEVGLLGVRPVVDLEGAGAVLSKEIGATHCGILVLLLKEIIGWLVPAAHGGVGEALMIHCTPEVVGLLLPIGIVKIEHAIGSVLHIEALAVNLFVVLVVPAVYG